MVPLYAVLCLLGTVLPLVQFFPWLQSHGLDLPLFFRELLSTRIGAFFGMDVFVSAAVLLIFIAAEARRARVPRAWLAMAATCLVGVSLGLPLFLLLRERALAARS